ncbi:phosphodiesterase [Haematococcus lacustris]|uniref:Phosphodiesterase n=1 Tax=Haematococcus lacustris TaxID=44745 RepID=A0A6A0AG56_HAELA|nr:phosphodiesterase [Haematococcus lacustris]
MHMHKAGHKSRIDWPSTSTPTHARSPPAPTVFAPLRRHRRVDGSMALLKGQYIIHWIKQPVDHFSRVQEVAAKTWKQRYVVCTDFWNPSGGPIFFYAGNEADVMLYVNATGLMWENALQFGALLVFAEVWCLAYLNPPSMLAPKSLRALGAEVLQSQGSQGRGAQNPSLSGFGMLASPKKTTSCLMLSLRFVDTSAMSSSSFTSAMSSSPCQAQNKAVGQLLTHHRYYGASQPFGPDSWRQQPGYLTSQQAMADFAHLMHALRNGLLPGAQDSPIIVFGGSYGGELAAWLRMKYPHLVAGAIAASAPIGAFPGVPGFEPATFWKVVTYGASEAAGAAAGCAPAVRAVFQHLMELPHSQKV